MCRFRPFFFLFCLLVYPACLSALEIPQKPQGYVSDYAGMLSSGARVRLEEKLARFEKETSNQVLVVTFPGLEDESLEDFSMRLAESWKPGQKGRDNGALLLLFKNDRKIRIEVGYGLEGVLTDALSQLIIQNEIVPEFRQGRFENGIERGVEALMQASRSEYKPQPQKDTQDTGFLQVAFFLGIFSLLNRRFILLAVQGTCLLIGFFMPSDLFVFISVVFGIVGLMTSTGRGGYFIGGTRQGRWSGGGFGGGGFRSGGGSFGGGGASGRW